MRFLCLALFGLLAWAEDAPQWAKDAAATPSHSFPPQVATEILFQEEQLTVAPDGRQVMRERGAIRLLQRSRSTISAWRSYNTKTGRIRDFRGWLLGADGRGQQLKPDRILDVALSQQETYDEGRAKTLDCPSNSPPGSVFAWEIVEEEKTIFTQYEYEFQNQAPVSVSRFILTLPAGWRQHDITFNHAPVKPTADGQTFTWELRDLPWIEREAFSPGMHSISPWLAVTYSAPPDTPLGTNAFEQWPGVSGWLSPFVEPSAEVTAAVREKAAALTSNAHTEIEKIRAIGAFAQQVNYVSVQMNLTRGGGYTPHRADAVLKRNYGDCKDKAALMKALLKAAGIDSFVTVAYSGNRNHVRNEWPSPWQFNHAIVAIKVGPDMQFPAILPAHKLGRLLFFDPTDPHTPVGELPESEQGSRMLVIAGAQGDLVTVPRPPAAENRVESRVEAKLALTGVLEAKLNRQYFGQSASPIRSIAARDGKDELRKLYERGFSARLGGVNIKSVQPADQRTEHRMDVSVDFEAKGFGQFQASLLIIKPGTLVPGTYYVFPAKPRKLPVELSADLRTDQIAIQLPPGYKVDEMPPPIELKSDYGTYRARCTVKADQFLFEQRLEVVDKLAPASEYEQIRDFFEKVAGYAHAAAVLVKN